jgi:hypothetical protein
MVKKETPFEVMLFLFIGMKPKEIISMGYPLATVYKYSSRYDKIHKRFMEKLIPQSPAISQKLYKTEQ